MRLAKKVLLIGWDAADWKIISPMLDAGLLPTLNKFVEQGVMGNLATLDPPLSPILWTSIATGKTADEHGILGFVEPDANNQAVRPVSSRSRKVKALWNILSQKGLKSNVVGWWPSNPAEPINGVMVSNFFQKVKAKYGEPWPMPDGSIHPKAMEHISEWRVHPGELTLSHILPFVPDALKVDQEKDKHLSSVAKILAECSSIHGAATWLMQNTEWDFMAVYYDAIDHFCHGFMKFHPPQRKNIPDNLYELYKDVVQGAYRFHDMMLERMLQLAGDDTTVIIMSDHGFHSDHLRPNRIPKEPAGPAFEHAPFGIFTMKGPHIKKDERIYGATLLDIAPTVLTLFGLPVGKDMIGKSLLQSFNKKVEPTYIDSWENVTEGDAGMLPGDVREDPWAAKAAMDQLIELGYVEKPGEDKEKALKKITDESQFYLARVLMYRKKFGEAMVILEKIFSENIDKLRFGLALHECYMALNKNEECRVLMDKLRTTEAAELARLDLLEAGLFIAENKPRKAMELLEKAEQRSAHLPYYYNELGRVYQRLGKWEKAQQAYNRALDIDANNASAHLGIARSLLRTKEYEQAAEESLAAIGLMYAMPQAHYCLGEAMYNLELYHDAAMAFEVVISQAPGSRKAHQWLLKIYKEHLHDEEKIKYHEQFIMENIKGTITVVSGLPRTGTSMIMQMLKAGGVEILTDNIRANDNNNPKGYLEFEKVKSLFRDNTWVNEAVDKAVKVVAPLLPNLPAAYNYKIIIMQRDMDEVLRSQQVMLGHNRAVRQEAYPIALAEAFTKQLEKADAWIARTPGAEVLKLNYKEVIANPQEAAETIASFLDEEMEIDKMVEVVDASLYRTKGEVKN